MCVNTLFVFIHIKRDVFRILAKILRTTHRRLKKENMYITKFVVKKKLLILFGVQISLFVGIN